MGTRFAPAPAPFRSRLSSFLPQAQCLFFLSGFSALVLEVTYVMLLRYWVGNTAHAIAAVLCAFMGGLALGSWAAGHWLLRARNLLALYGGMELFAGLFSLALPAVIGRFHPAFFAFITRLGPDSGKAVVGNFLAGIVLLSLPTLLMGASFPVVVRAASEVGRDRSEPAERLYAANLLGAALGALLVDFVFIRFWGIAITLAVVAATSGLVAVWAVGLGRRREPEPSPPVESAVQNPKAHPAKSLVMAVAVAGGFLVLFQEIVWTRMAGEFLDNSVYGFAVTLFAVMAGLAAGAWLVPRRFGRRPAESSLAWICSAAGGLVLLLIPFWDLARVLTVKHPFLSVGAAAAMLALAGVALLPGLKSAGYGAGSLLVLLAAVWLLGKQGPGASLFWTHHAVDFSVSLLFMFIPALLMGLVLPLVLAWHVESAGRERASVAPVYSANTLGCLMGIVAATFWVIPHWGVEGSGRASGLALLSLGLILWTRRLSDPWKVVWILIPAVGWTWLVPHWDFSREHAVLGHPGRVVYAREDLNGGLTTVLQYAGVRQIYSNGVYEAGNDYETLDQARLALLPLLHVQRAERATVIGVGSGQTAGIISLWPFQNIEVVDYSPGVLEAAQKYFQNINYDFFSDPRVRLHVADGRHYLDTHPHKVDLIVIEVSRLWQAGEGDLYTREFYEAASARLNDQGVLEQWIPLFDLSVPDTLVLLRTVRTVFPYVAVYMGEASGMVVASQSPLAVLRARLQETDANPRLADLLKSLQTSSAGGLLGDCVLTPEGLDAMLAREGDRRISTDLWPRLEHSVARHYLENQSGAPLRRYLLKAEEFQMLPVVGADAISMAAIQKEAASEHSRLLRSLPGP